jgi:hypothetical protein
MRSFPSEPLDARAAVGLLARDERARFVVRAVATEA